MENIPTEKERLWSEKRQEVAKYEDGGHNVMDEGIIETVTALNILGIPTAFSCWGHSQGSPYVQLKSPDGHPGGRPNGTKEWEEKFKKWEMEWDQPRKIVEDLLNEFNTTLGRESKLRLKLDVSGNIKVTDDEMEKIEERGSPDIDLNFKYTEEEKNKLKSFLPVAQDVMTAFTKFLKEKYFES